jgi:single-stranded-DNA-specific exonuclease
MFYILIALRAELRKRSVFTLESQPKLEQLLSLVALGTVADVAQLDRNNRILVSQGLKKIRQRIAPAGLLALFEVAGRDPRLANPFDLGFAIGPRLNAAGRLADMSLGIQLLLSDHQDDAMVFAQELDRMNRERRVIESGMQESALANLSRIEIEDRPALCLWNPSWHQGVVGIVASRLKERFNRGAITTWLWSLYSRLSFTRYPRFSFQTISAVNPKVWWTCNGCRSHYSAIRLSRV